MILGLLAWMAPLAGEAGQPVFSADLVGPKGYFVTWQARGIEGAVGCKLVAEMIEAYHDEKWNSVFTVSVLGETDEARLALQLWRPRNGDSLRSSLLIGSRKAVQTPLAYTSAIHAPVAIAVRWSQDRIEFLIDDGVVADAPRTFPVKGLELTVSTAEVELTSLSFQYAEPAGDASK
jgi:hypothetical protein